MPLKLATYLQVLAAGFLLASLSGIQPASGQPVDRPNVIVLFSDDHGTLDLNIYGSEDLSTPNLDALARSGVRFTQFYAAAPVCSPSRGALLTGRYPIRNGVMGNGNFLNEDEITIAEMLKEAGYHTGQFGKWHIGHGRPDEHYAEGRLPNEEGFDYSFGFLGGCIGKWSHFNWGGAPWGDPPKRHDLHRNGKEIWETGTHSGDLIARETNAFMEEHRDEPFFAYVAFGSPHYPMHPYDKYRKYYKDLPMKRRKYAGLVSTLDEQVGMILDKVKELGIEEETLIIFQSDHGHSVEARANYGGGNAGPYRGAKFSMFEGGIRVPAIVSMPGTVPAGAVRDQLAHGTDWLPTIAEAAGIDLPDRTIDGESLWPVIESADLSSPHGVVHWQAWEGERAEWAVREGPWKLIGNPRDPTETGPVEAELFLSNLKKDKTEMTNFAEDYPDIVRRLKREYEELVRQERRL